METDASDFALGSVLSQRDTENRLHPVAFHSRKFSPAEINYKIHDKELLAVVDSFKHWRRYLEGAKHQVQVFSDHQNLEYFTTTKVLNRRQAQWAQELAGIDFNIYYRPGSQNGKPDALSRRSEDRPEKGGDEDQPITTILHKNHFAEAVSTREYWSGVSYIIGAARLSSIPVRKWHEEFLVLVREKGLADPGYLEALREVEGRDELALVAVQREAGPDGRDAEEEAALPHEELRMARKARSEGILGIKDGLLYRRGMLWIPEDKNLITTVLESDHDVKVAGHMGHDKTIELVPRNFWWPKMDQQIINYVRACVECQKNKASCHHPYRLLSPLELP